MTEPTARVRLVRTVDLAADETAEIRALLTAAFDDDDPDERFGEDDWQHALGGIHAVVESGGAIVSHASVVDRELHVDGQALRAGYVEAVATLPSEQRRGFGTVAMRAMNAVIRRDHELGALGTGAHGFYERLGWERWHGPTSVRIDGRDQRTPDEDGFILVLRTSRSPVNLELTAPISCDWRPGDVW
ncbi:MAG TPA: GNAT family N-acetyltransferase [Candidatus Limnocylindrales bacterium]|jgi:aminoglycoside 2'-N-acetyltransferase I